MRMTAPDAKHHHQITHSDGPARRDLRCDGPDTRRKP